MTTESESPTKSETPEPRENAPPEAPTGELAGLTEQVNALAKEVARLRKQRKSAANPWPSRPLSAEAIETLHKLYQETGDEALARVLDEVCDDPGCEAEADDE